MCIQCTVVQCCTVMRCVGLDLYFRKIISYVSAFKYFQNILTVFAGGVNARPDKNGFVHVYACVYVHT